MCAPLIIIIYQQFGNLEEMEKFLETYNFPRLNHDEIENLNRLFTSKEIESVIKNLPRNKSPQPEGFTSQFYKTWRRINNNPYQTLPKNRKQYFQKDFIRPALS